jgi:chemotaxis protein MotB
MKKTKNNQSENEGGGNAGWLCTFNDLVTLLMVFFVLLFTMGSVDTKKMAEFQYALQSGLGVLREGDKVSVSVKEHQPVQDMSHVYTQAEGEVEELEDPSQRVSLEYALRVFGPNIGVRVTYTLKGARLAFDDYLLFEFGKASIRANGLPILDKLADVIKSTPYRARVEGHTDNVPIHTRQFPSNWELSIARAVNVVKYLAEVKKIDSRRLSAVGYGESRPVGLNNSPVKRAKNRRVEIVLLMEGKG